MRAGEQQRFDLIVAPAARYLSECRAGEIIESSQGDLVMAEWYHQRHKLVIAKLQATLSEWKASGQFPTCQRKVKRLLEGYV